MHSPIFYGTDDLTQYLDKPFSTSDHPHDIHNVSPLRKLGTLVPRGIGGFVKRNFLIFSIIKVLSINLSLIIVI